MDIELRKKHVSYSRRKYVCLGHLYSHKESKYLSCFSPSRTYSAAGYPTLDCSISRMVNEFQLIDVSLENCIFTS